MTIFFKNHEITIYRNRKVANKDQFSMSATYTGYDADIQPASQERTEFFNGRAGATFTAYVQTDANIKEQDQIRTEDGKKYTVKGVARWDGAGLLDHLEITMVSQDG